MKKYFYGFLSVLTLFIIWYLFALRIDNSYILPSPITVIKTFINLLQSASTYLTILLTLFRLLIALIGSFIIGVILGVISGNYQGFSYFLRPIVSSLRSLPVASIIIIIIILIGSDSSLYIITFLMVFPIIYEATLSGVKNISQDLQDSISLEPKHKLIVMTKLQIPLAFPYILTSIFQSLGLGFKVIVMAEFIAQSSKGIGFELFRGSISINYELVFAWTFIIIILVILMEFFIKKMKKLLI